MTTSKSFPVVLLPLCVSPAATVLPAQTAYVLTRDASSGLRPAIAVRLPGPVVPFLQYWERPELPNYYAGSIAATGTPLPPVAHEGDIAIDQDALLVYATDGTSFLSQDAHSRYGAVPTASTVALPLPGWPGGALTGLAVAAGAGLLYVCDGSLFQPRSKTHPYPAAAPAMAMPPFLGAPGATGLDYDPSTGTLWACNVDGATVNFTTAGALVAAFPAPPVPGLAPVRGIAINPMAGPFAMPPIVPQTPGFEVCLTNGSVICDALPPFGTIAVPPMFPTHCRGLAIASDPILLPGRYNTVSGTHEYESDPVFAPFYPQIRMSRPTNTFAATPSDLTLDGAPPSVPALLIANVMPLPVPGDGLVLDDDVLWVNPFGSGVLLGPVGVDAAGHATITMPIGLPVGFHIVTQWGVADPAALLGVRFTDALMFRLGLL